MYPTSGLPRASRWLVAIAGWDWAGLALAPHNAAPAASTLTANIPHPFMQAPSVT
jgi:hypothetical protein